jgi:exopolysaccharide biosynthesis polyprenyl glycosylphosphotransferase
MSRLRPLSFVLLLLDLAAVALTFNFVAWVWLRIDAPTVVPFWSPLLLPMLFCTAAIYLIEGYKPRTDMMSLTYTSQHAIALVGTLFLTLLVVHVVIPEGFTLQMSRFVTIGSYLLLIPVTLSYRRHFYRVGQARREQRYFLFIGSPEACEAFREDCAKSRMTQTVLYSTHEALMTTGSASHPPGDAPGDISRYLDQYTGQIDAIILRESSQELPPRVAQRLIDLQLKGVPTFTLELFNEAYWRKVPLYRLNQTWLFQEGFHISREPVFVGLKRFSDVLFAGVGLLAMVLLLPVIALAIWLEDRGPVFFSQTRVGLNRRPFRLFKFRTMRVAAEGEDYTQPGDMRITRVGHLLRASRLDELPQLWNVLRGEMSLIGPRAEWIKLVERYEAEIPCYHFRHLVKPGITGWAQVNYPYGANLEDTLRKLEYDLYYVRHFSFVLDASIVLKTVHVMLFGKGR